MTKNIELSIIMPCLNEHETLESSLQEALLFFKDHQEISGEILVADNGSTDGSLEIAKKYEDQGVRVAHVKNKGYGNALIGGTKAAKGKYCIMGDPDNSYDFYHLMPFIERLRNGDDLVMGNRFKGGIEKGAMPWSHRYIGTPILSFIGRLFYHNKIGDFNCGLRGYNRERIMALHLCTSGMEYASEMIVQSALNNYKISEVPTVLRVDGRSSAPHLSTWSDGWRHLRFLLMYSPKWLFLYPGLVLFVVGLIGMLSILWRPIDLYHTTFSLNTSLFFGGFILAGIQNILFTLFSYIYAKNTTYFPVTDRIVSKIEKITLEKGVLLGSFLFLVGLCLAIFAVVIWGRNDFGSLNVARMMRITIPAVIFMIMGIQIIFGAFFAGILDIKVNNSEGQE